MTVFTIDVTCHRCGADPRYVNSTPGGGTRTVTVLECPDCRLDLTVDTTMRTYGRERPDGRYRHRQENR